MAKKKITVELDAVIVELLEEMADATGETLSDMLTEAAMDYLQEAGGYIFPE